MTRTRLLRSAIPLALLAGAAAAPQAQANGDLSFYYVASATGTGGDLFTSPPLVGDAHPFGWISFASPGRTFTLTLDDTGTVTGATIPVEVYVSGAWSRRCVPARTPTRLPGGRRGADVHIFVDTAWDAGLRCSGSGTTGTAHIAP